MTEMGKAMIGAQQAEGEDHRADGRRRRHPEPLLDEVSLRGAKAVLVNVTGGLDMTLLEVDEAANAVRAGRSRGQHHLRRGLRPEPGGPHAGLRRGHRHG
jgi:cell division GTPase FtsZ